MLANQYNVGAIIQGFAGGYIDGFAQTNTSYVTSLTPAPEVVFSRFGADDIYYKVPVA